MPPEEPARIIVQVKPDARQNRITGCENGVWHLTIAAPPVKGKANRELIRFLSGVLGIAQSNLTIEKGVTGRRKMIAVSGLTASQVTRQLEISQ